MRTLKATLVIFTFAIPAYAQSTPDLEAKALRIWTCLTDQKGHGTETFTLVGVNGKVGFSKPSVVPKKLMDDFVACRDADFRKHRLQYYNRNVKKG